MTVYDIRVKHNLSCGHTTTREKEPHPETILTIKHKATCINWGNTPILVTHTYGIEPPIIKQAGIFVSLISILVKYSGTRAPYGPNHPGSGQQDNNILYPRVDQLSTLMEWFQRLNTFHGWGLPKFKKYDSVNLTGIEFDPTSMDLETLITVHGLKVIQTLKVEHIKVVGPTTEGTSVITNYVDHTERTMDYELFGENWHFEYMLFQIVDWLKQLSVILGIPYWEDLLAKEHNKISYALSNDQYLVAQNILTPWQIWREYTKDIAKDNYDKGKFSFKDYQVLFPEELSKLIPQNFDKKAFGCRKLYHNPNYAWENRFVILGAGLIGKVFPDAYGNLLQVRFVYAQYNSNGTRTIFGNSDWVNTGDCSESTIAADIAAAGGGDVTEVSMTTEWIIAEFSLDQGTKYFTQGLGVPFVGVQFKYAHQTYEFGAQQNPYSPGQFSTFYGWTSGCDLGDFLDTTIPTYSYGVDPLQYESNFAVWSKTSIYGLGNGSMAVKLTDEEVHMYTIFLDKLTLLERYGIKSDTYAGTKIRIAQIINEYSFDGRIYPYASSTTVTPELRTFWEDNTPDPTAEQKFYCGFTNEITEFTTLDKPIANEEVYNKLTDIVTSGTLLTSFTGQYPNYVGEVDLDASMLFGDNDKICLFFGFTRTWDKSILSGFKTGPILHKFHRELSHLYEINSIVYTWMPLSRYFVLIMEPINTKPNVFNFPPALISTDNYVYKLNEATVP